MLKTFPIHDVPSRKAFVTTMLDNAQMSFTRVDGTQWGIGIMTFPDGCSVQGSSVCVKPEDYDEAIGASTAFKDCIAKAETHYWRVAGYLAMVGTKELTIPFNVTPAEVNTAYEQ